MRRPKTIVLRFDDGMYVYAVKYTVLRTAPSNTKEFPCGHCPSVKATPQMDIVQFGFLDDSHQLICYCPDCLQVTVFEYKIGDEHA